MNERMNVKPHHCHLNSTSTLIFCRLCSCHKILAGPTSYFPRIEEYSGMLATDKNSISLVILKKRPQYLKGALSYVCVPILPMYTCLGASYC